MTSSGQQRRNPEAGRAELLAALEPDQLSAVKRHFPRRNLKSSEVIILWGLRLYVLFMLGVVVYQVWTGPW
jgi:hypothetical protein